MMTCYNTPWPSRIRFHNWKYSKDIASLSGYSLPQVKLFILVDLVTVCECVCVCVCERERESVCLWFPELINRDFVNAVSDAKLEVI